jgi:hypothetical protein
VNKKSGHPKKARRLLNMTRFERFSEPMAPRRVFFGRVLKNGAAAAIGVMISILAGWGIYYLFWPHRADCTKPCSIDALHRVVMLATGMGPLGGERGIGERIFVDFYALFSSVIMVGVVGLILAPIFHRVMHYLHLSEEED